jgi:flagellar assembly factor FliW
MPEILTRRFGKVQFEETAVLHFPAGLPGFESHTRFLLIERPANAPLVFLQSIDSPELSFCTAPVAAIDPAYRLAMTEEDQRLLSATDPPVILAILSSTTSHQWTANLLAPIVIDLPSRRAVQAVRADARYSHQHRLAEAKCS